MERQGTSKHQYSFFISRFFELGNRTMEDQLLRLKERICAEEFEDRLESALNDRDQVIWDMARYIILFGPDNHKGVANMVNLKMQKMGEISNGIASAFMIVTGVNEALTQSRNSYSIFSEEEAVESF